MDITITNKQRAEVLLESEYIQLQEVDEIILLKRLATKIYQGVEQKVKEQNLEWKGISKTMVYIVGETYCNYEFFLPDTYTLEYGDLMSDRFDKLIIKCVDKIFNNLDDYYSDKSFSKA